LWVVDSATARRDARRFVRPDERRTPGSHGITARAAAPVGGCPSSAGVRVVSLGVRLTHRPAWRVDDEDASCRAGE
jgi:hypothetical protein